MNLRQAGKKSKTSTARITNSIIANNNSSSYLATISTLVRISLSYPIHTLVLLNLAVCASVFRFFNTSNVAVTSVKGTLCDGFNLAEGDLYTSFPS